MSKQSNQHFVQPFQTNSTDKKPLFFVAGQLLRPIGEAPIRDFN